MSNKKGQAPYVRLDNISKSFNHVKALVDASLSAYEGEVLAIIGDNGAGKSTLIKILSGVLKPDSGKIVVGEKTFDSLDVNKALEVGISTVYQDLSLGNSMDVASNIFLGHEITKCGFLDKKAMRAESERLLEELEIDIQDSRAIVGDLSGGQRQGVAVARLVHHGGHVLIFDEPTAAMGVVESEHTLNFIKSLAQKGMAVMLICHNLQQVFDTADRIAVMRHGRVISEDEKSNMTMKDVLALLTSADHLVKTDEEVKG